MIPNLQAPTVLPGLVFTTLSNALDPSLIIYISFSLLKQSKDSRAVGQTHLGTQSRAPFLEGLRRI